MARAASSVTALARLLLSSLFLWSGSSALMNPAGTAQYFASESVPAPALMVWVVILIELGGGLAVLVGFKARYAAGALAIWCLMTALFVHLADALHGSDATVAFDNMIHFYKNLVMAGGLLYVAALGAGGFSIDDALSSRRRV